MNGVANFDFAYYRQIRPSLNIGVFGHVMHSKADVIKLNRKFDARLDMGSVGVSLSTASYISEQVGLHLSFSAGILNSQVRFGLVDSIPKLDTGWDFPFVKCATGVGVKIDEFNEVVWELTGAYYGGDSRITFPKNYILSLSDNRIMLGFGLTYIWRLHKVTSDDFLE